MRLPLLCIRKAYVIHSPLLNVHLHHSVNSQRPPLSTARHCVLQVAAILPLKAANSPINCNRVWSPSVYAA